MKQCVRCWVHIKEETNRLWCSKCEELVRLELDGKVDKPFEYYFKYHLKRCRKENREMSQ